MAKEGGGQLTRLSLKELAELDDGRIATAFDMAIKRVADDCNDRPGETKPRTVTLQIEIAPVLDVDGMCDTVKSRIQIKDSIPTRKSKLYDFGLRKGGILAFNNNSLGNHKQESFLGDDDE